MVNAAQRRSPIPILGGVQGQCPDGGPEGKVPEAPGF